MSMIFKAFFGSIYKCKLISEISNNFTIVPGLQEPIKLLSRVMMGSLKEQVVNKFPEVSRF